MGRKINALLLLLLLYGCGWNNPFKAPELPRPAIVKLIYPDSCDTLGWNPVSNREKYRLQISKTDTFIPCIIDTTILDPNCFYLLADTVKYFWRVKVQIPTYHAWSHWSNIWSFEVKKINHPPDTPCNPSPIDGAINTSINIALEWRSGDPDGDTVFYFLYFGKDTLFAAPETIIDPSGIIPAHISYPLTTLEYTTKYYWKVVAKDIWDIISTSPVWNFTTGGPNLPPNIPNPPTGPNTGYIDEICTFTAQTTDADGDSVRYKFSFGDSMQSDWSTFVASGELGSASHTYRKLGTFYIKAKAQDIHFQESEWSDSMGLSIKVGRGAIWVADNSGNKVVKLGSGGSILAQFDDQGIPPWHHGTFKQPLTLRVDPIDGCCWIVCTYNQGIFKLAPNCSLLVWSIAPENVYWNPSTPCIDKNHDCWVSLAWHNQGEDSKIVKYDRWTMMRLDSIIDNLGNITYPIAIELDVDSNWLWVVEMNPGSGYVSKFDVLTHERLFQLPGFSAFWAEVDPITHYCWVADLQNNQVAKISPSGEIRRFGGFVNPICLSINPNTQEVWVANRGDESGNDSRVVKLSGDGSELCSVTGLKFAMAVEVDPNDGTCWIADAGNNRIVKVSTAGNILFEVKGFVTPAGLSLNPNADP
ncbi:MAG: hypothetical protein HY769_06835 [Candidatus Stahlbacteria bacterium]|nr:hypothetical protein [Candidatus Stahlbacteria bacterium]